MDSTALGTLWPATSQLQQAFTNAVVLLDGTVRDVYDDGTSLFMRAVLPATAQVQRADHVRAGVAMRTKGTEILVHPYTFREICSNGAVQAHAIGTTVVKRTVVDDVLVAANAYESAAALVAMERAVAVCAAPECFTQAMHEMRASLDEEATVAIERLQLIVALQRVGSSRLGLALTELVSPLIDTAFFGRFDGDRSAFAFGNALTAAGRDQSHPALRWALEEYGAAVFAAAVPTQAPPVAWIPGEHSGLAKRDQVWR